MFAGEISPSDMYKLLTSEWSIPSELELTLMNSGGGNIHFAYRALQRFLTNSMFG